MSTTTQEKPKAAGVMGLPTVERKLPNAQAHLGTIALVAAKSFDSGATAIVITVRSDHNGAEFDNNLWLPPAFAANPRVDPSTLSDTSEELSEKTGRPKMSDRQKYASSINNDDGDAQLQIAAAIAASQGKESPADAQFETLDEFCALLHELLSGTSVCFTTRPEKEGDFKGTQRFGKMYDPEEAQSLYAKGKLFKKGYDVIFAE